MWVEFGNKFHEVCDEFHERSEWNSRKRVKFISEFHEQGVDSYIITWITKNEKFTLFTGNYWIWETFLRSYAWDRGDLRNFPPRSNISPKLRNSLEKWRMGLRLTPRIIDVTVEFEDKFHGRSQSWLAHGTYPCNNTPNYATANTLSTS